MDFVGRRVRVSTPDRIVEGTVLAVKEGKLALKLPEGPVDVNAASIVDLEVLAASSSPSPGPKSSPKPRPRQTTPNAKQTKASTGKSTPTKLGPSKIATETTAKGKSPAMRRSEPQRPEIRQDRKWLEATNADFDFAANLDKFDKSAVFADLQRQDPIASSDRLVSHNKISTREPDYGANHGTRPHSKYLAHEQGRDTRRVLDDPARKLRPSEMVMDIPRASPLQLVQVESFMLGQGWHRTMLVEAAARGVAQVMLHHVLRSVILDKVVLVLAGNNRSGVRALAAGRVLLTRGCRVLAVVLPGNDSALSDELRTFRASGGRVLGSRKQILGAVAEYGGNIDIIIDALQGIERASVEEGVNEEVGAASQWLLQWGTDTLKPSAVVAIDCPSRTHTGYCITATHLVSCGWPLQGITGPQESRFVVDEGVPVTVLESLGLAQLEIMFGMGEFKKW